MFVGKSYAFSVVKQGGARIAHGIHWPKIQCTFKLCAGTVRSGEHGRFNKAVTYQRHGALVTYKIPTGRITPVVGFKGLRISQVPAG